MKTSSLSRTCLVSAVITLAVVEPTRYLISRVDTSINYEQSHWYAALLVLTFLVMPVIIGGIAAIRHMPNAFRGAAAAVAASSGSVVVVAAIRKLAGGISLPASQIVKYVIYVQFTVLLGMVAAYMAIRSVSRQMLKRTSA